MAFIIQRMELTSYSWEIPCPVIFFQRTWQVVLPSCLIGLYATSANDICCEQPEKMRMLIISLGMCHKYGKSELPEQMALITSNFNSITARTIYETSATEPVEGQWNWESADKIANFARANKIGFAVIVLSGMPKLRTGCSMMKREIWFKERYCLRRTYSYDCKIDIRMLSMPGM